MQNDGSEADDGSVEVRMEMSQASDIGETHARLIIASPIVREST